MPQVPDEIVDKKAVTVRNWFLGIGFLSGFICLGAILNENVGQAFWTGVIAALLIWIATKIKTTRKYRGGLYK